LHLSSDILVSKVPCKCNLYRYTLAEGSCPKSYGVNVARLAGLPESVLAAAAERSAALESGSGCVNGGAAVGGLVCAALAAASTAEEQEVATGAGGRKKVVSLRDAWVNARRALGLSEKM
jgi:DNA mismatch repair ATPase MutS